MEGNAQKTIAELYGVPFPSIQPDIRLLTRQDKKRAASRRIYLTPETALNLHLEDVPTPSGQSYFRQTVSIGGGDDMEIYPACGHSPDSICIRAGDVLFIGDLLAAANPMVAGISGWQREEHIETLRQVRGLLESLPVRMCYPGHGGIIPAEKACDILKKLERKTAKLGDVALMNEQRLFQIADYALELIDEAEEVFSAIAGRLLYVACRLDELEEEEAASRCRKAMPMDRMDDCLMECRDLCRRLNDGKIMRVEFAHGVLHAVEKIRSLFDPQTLSAILPRTLIHRGESLLLDFIGMADGCRNLEEFIPVDVNELVAAVVGAWHQSPHQNAAILDFADDYDRYLAELVLRIGHEPPGKRMPLTFTPDARLPFIGIAAGRFFDTLLNFLEWLALGHPSSITMVTHFEGEGLLIRIMPEGKDVSFVTPHEVKKIHSFQRRFRICGLTLQPEKDGLCLRPVKEQGEDI